jgi:hypothetical protein
MEESLRHFSDFAFYHLYYSQAILELYRETGSSRHIPPLIASLQEALRISPYFYRTRLHLIRTLMESGREQEASAEIQQCRGFMKAFPHVRIGEADRALLQQSPSRPQNIPSLRL